MTCPANQPAISPTRIAYNIAPPSLGSEFNSATGRPGGRSVDEYTGVMADHGRHRAATFALMKRSALRCRRTARLRAEGASAAPAAALAEAERSEPTACLAVAR